MATTTPLFGWSVPTSSDLVKNGAVAIETLGDSIDASMGDLLGGTTDQVLAKNSNTDMDFKWVTPAAGGGGKVLQVVSAVSTTQTSIATTTLTDTTITATITPTAATSTILVIISAEFFNNALANNVGSKARLLRDSTTIADYTGESFNYLAATGATAVSWAGILPVTYLDSPATTSATTYKLQAAMNSLGGSASMAFQYLSTPSTITLLEIGA